MIELNNDNFDSEINDSRPVLVDFWAVWCGPCRAQAPILDKLDESTVKVCKVNVDENPELSSRFGIVSIPTLIVFKNGEQKKKVMGVHNLEQLNELISNAF